MPVTERINDFALKIANTNGTGSVVVKDGSVGPAYTLKTLNQGQWIDVEYGTDYRSGAPAVGWFETGYGSL